LQCKSFVSKIINLFAFSSILTQLLCYHRPVRCDSVLCAL